jgi:tetratricopeptide (TPR) repeat protein
VGAKFRLKVFNELKTRGCQDILIAVVDGLKGLAEAIGAANPRTTVQTCIVHLIRNSLEHASYKDRKAVATALRQITIPRASRPHSSPCRPSLRGSLTWATITAQRKDSDAKLSNGDASGAESASNQVAAKEMVKVAIAQMSQGKLDDAEKELSDAAARDPKQSLVYYNMAVLRLKQGRTDDAFKELEASFLNGFSYFDEMQKDPDLDAIRNDPRFTALIKKYRTTT